MSEVGRRDVLIGAAATTVVAATLPDLPTAMPDWLITAEAGLQADPFGPLALTST